MYKHTANPSEIKSYIKQFLMDARTPEKRKLFFLHPDSDFTRNRKIGLEDLVLHLFSRSSGPLTHNLQTDFGLGRERPSKSALVQQTEKLRVRFFRHLFDSINARFHRDFLYKGKYRLLACDGSDLGVGDRSQETLKEKAGGRNKSKDYHSVHINALYDILSESFADCIIEKGCWYNEQEACWKMAEALEDTSIVICDRGYESYNLFAHIASAEQFFLIRVKDPTTRTGGMAYSWWNRLDGPDGEGEVLVDTRITRVQSRAVKASPLFHSIPNGTSFDFLPSQSPFKQGRHGVLPEDIPPEHYHELSFRLVRFRINPPGSENEFETVATNLPEKEFPAEELKRLYHLRWTIETGYRELKYDELLSRLHSVKVDSVIKEVYIALTLHNITSYLLSSAGRRLARKGERDKTVCFEASHSDASHAVRMFLRRKNKDGPGKLMQELARNMEPVRDGRSFPRQLIHKGFVAFTYRAA